MTFATQPASVVISESQRTPRSAEASPPSTRPAWSASVAGSSPAPASAVTAHAEAIGARAPVQPKVVVPRGLQRDGERGAGGA